MLHSLQLCVPVQQAEADANAAQIGDLQRQLDSTRAELTAAAAAADSAAAMAAEHIQELQVQELFWLAAACSVESTAKKNPTLLSCHCTMHNAMSAAGRKYGGGADATAAGTAILVGRSMQRCANGQEALYTFQSCCYPSSGGHVVYAVLQFCRPARRLN